MKPIRVLHVVTHMNCGGLETMIMNYYRKMDRSKIQFDFLTHRQDNEKKGYDDEIRRLGGKIYHISRLNPFSIIYKKELDHFFETHNEYRIIHVHQDCLSSVILKSAYKNGIPVRIAHCHSSSQDKNIKYLIKLWYKRKIPKYSTGLFACGQIAGEWMFGKKTQFFVLPNAIDTGNYIFSTEKRRIMRQALGLPDNALVLGHVGRFSEVKNHKFLVELLRQISSNNNNVYMLFVGKGELMKNIQQMVSDNELDNKVLFLGLRRDVPDLLQAMDIFVLPSLYEGVPVSVIEAQAAGLPCLISNNVPQDCVITNLVDQVELEYSKWEEAIQRIHTTERRNTQKEIKLAHYDINENATYLTNYYISCYEQNK